MSQRSKYDEKMKSNKVYDGEMWDLDEVEKEYHRGKKRKPNKQKKWKRELKDDIQF